MKLFFGFIFLFAAKSFASNTALECAIPQYANGSFYVEGHFDGIQSQYSIGVEGADEVFQDLGFLKNVSVELNSRGTIDISGVLMSDGLTIDGYLTIKDGTGIYYSAGSGPTSNEDGLNPIFSVVKCINPQLQNN